MTGKLLVDRDGGIVIATIHQPERMNALDSSLRRDLTEFWRNFAADDDLKVAIVTGSGTRAFSAGRDLKETAAAYESGTRLDFESTKENGYPHLHKLGKPVIAAINGHCVAGGLVIALGCDIRICSENARFGNPQASRGRGTRSPLYLLRAGIPKAVAMDMVMTGDPISASRAYEIGLVSRVIANQVDLLPAAVSMAEKICLSASRVVNGVKSASEAGLLDAPGRDADENWDAATGGIMQYDEETRRRTIAFAKGDG